MTSIIAGRHKSVNYDPTRIISVTYVVTQDNHSGYCSYPTNENVKHYKEKVFYPCPLDFYPGELRTFDVDKMETFWMFNRPDKMIHFCCYAKETYTLISARIKSSIQYHRHGTNEPYYIRKEFIPKSTVDDC